MSNVLVISPHPDDESVGCGGAIAHHVDKGDAVRVVFLSSGEAGGHGTSRSETAATREQEAANATTILGVGDVSFWRLADGGLRASRSLVDRLFRLIADSGSDVVYTPYPKDAHPDHRAATRALGRAVSSIPPGERPEVLCYEVWTPIERIDHIVDISPFIDTKMAAIRAHASQCGVLRFDDAFEGLARYRGEMHSWPGGDHAEVFQTLSEQI
jgi:LmbE family N-acetylglucosaminyl deacetylase